MRQTTLLAFFDELSKLGTAFSETQYKKLYGPKITRKGKKFVSPKDGINDSQSTSLTSNDVAHNSVSSANRVAEGRETPGGPI